MNGMKDTEEDSFEIRAGGVNNGVLISVHSREIWQLMVAETNDRTVEGKGGGGVVEKDVTEAWGSLLDRGSSSSQS